MNHESKKQNGMIMFIFVVILFLGVTTYLVGLASKMKTNQTHKVLVTQKTMDYLVQEISLYAKLNQQIPCPASQTETDNSLKGTESCPVNANSRLIPWKTLGIPKEKTLDEWGRQISYYTRTNSTGASSVEIDMPNKISIDKNGTAIDDAVFVLVSHGKTGFRAYLPWNNNAGAAASRLFNQTPTNSLELDNAAPNANKHINSHITNVQPDDSSHFDDLVKACDAHCVKQISDMVIN